MAKAKVLQTRSRGSRHVNVSKRSHRRKLNVPAELHAPITSEIEEDLKNLVTKYGEKKVHKALDRLITKCNPLATSIIFPPAAFSLIVCCTDARRDFRSTFSPGYFPDSAASAPKVSPRRGDPTLVCAGVGLGFATLPFKPSQNGRVSRRGRGR
jgi:hypothetical protein